MSDITERLYISLNGLHTSHLISCRIPVGNWGSCSEVQYRNTFILTYRTMYLNLTFSLMRILLHFTAAAPKPNGLFRCVVLKEDLFIMLSRTVNVLQQIYSTLYVDL